MIVLKKLVGPLIAIVIFCGSFFALYAWRVSQNPFRRTDLRFEGQWPLRGDDQLGYSGLIEGSSHMRKLDAGLVYDLFTDRHGARINRIGEQKPDSVTIMTIGGSCAYGYGMNNEDTFSELLGQKLNVPVANFAQVGYSTVQSLISLQRHQDMAPKFVIYGFIDDHLQRNLAPCAPSGAPYCLPAPYLHIEGDEVTQIPPNMDYFTPEQNWRYYREILTTDKPSWRDLIWRMRIDLFQIKTSSELRPAQSPEQQAVAMKWLLNRMADTCDQIGARLVVLHIPYFFKDEVNPPPQELLDALDERMLFVDLSPLIPDPKPYGIPGDGHPNQRAHQLIASALEGHLVHEAPFAP